MSKQKTIQANSLLQEMFQAGVYKRTQGKIARQVTFAALLVTFMLAAYSLWNLLRPLTPPSWMEAAAPAYSLPFLLLVIGAWFSFRLVNYHVFADFLIAVEAEMNKVSWPSRGELFRSSMVVLIVIFGLMGVLYLFDFFWAFLFKTIGVLK
ncbi:preprotein translocase subunit SecE [Lignipirellula cremea]|uniref:Protein translocase subunit SecE n=1 Tax=Lignipirellula cremea TaxID=2528010 RepID=A0A518E2J3_9BACT|nr:preprotein translocase subunit SecE [Lignipirellula cremea]QDU98310.1 preprotein translocase subunit SecE [Lignipirellula cremea]